VDGAAFLGDVYARFRPAIPGRRAGSLTNRQKIALLTGRRQPPASEYPAPVEPAAK